MQTPESVILNVDEFQEARRNTHRRNSVYSNTQREELMRQCRRRMPYGRLGVHIWEGVPTCRRILCVQRCQHCPRCNPINVKGTHLCPAVHTTRHNHLWHELLTSLAILPLLQQWQERKSEPIWSYCIDVQGVDEVFLGDRVEVVFHKFFGIGGSLVGDWFDSASPDSCTFVEKGVSRG